MGDDLRSEGVRRYQEELAKPVQTRDALLVEREKTHGDFELIAALSQDLKNVLHKWNTAANFSPRKMEALEMICVKIARAMHGNQSVKDHWDDIAGYAKLGSEACDG